MVSPNTAVLGNHPTPTGGDYQASRAVDSAVLSEWVKAHGFMPVSSENPRARELSAPDERVWVNWRYIPNLDNDKPRKVLCSPDGRFAKSTDPATWSTFAEVVAAQDRFEGVGIVFTGTTLGIDLDNCVEDGRAPDAIAAFLEKADTYVELSPSRSGLHVLLKLSDVLQLERNRHGNYECYTEGRFFTFTGEQYGEPKPVRTISAKDAVELLQMLGYPWQKEALASVPQTVSMSLEDQRVLDLMFASKHGKDIQALYNGNTFNYAGDNSAADAALCSHLAFYTGKNAEQMERIWLASPLGSRKKTQSRKDYRERTIIFANKNCKEVYAPQYNSGPAPSSLYNPSPMSAPPSMSFMRDTDLLETDIPPVEWQIERLFAKGTLNMISAPPNQYKSMLALRMAMSVAHGTPLFGEFDVEKTNVLFVEEEDTIAMLKERYSMLLEEGEEAGGIYFAVDTGRKIDAAWAKELIEQAEARGARFIILDSLRALHMASENDSDEMQPVMDTLKAITRKGITVLYTHHHRKSVQGINSEQSDSAMDAARGSSAITAAVHGHITCHEKKGGDHYIVVHQAKLKADRKIDPFKVRIGSMLEPRKLTFTYAGPYDSDMAAVDTMESKLIDHFKKNRGAVFTRKQLVALGFAKSPEDRTLRDALARLVDEEKIRGVAFKELSDYEKAKKEGRAPGANATVYTLPANAEEPAADF